MMPFILGDAAPSQNIISTASSSTSITTATSDSDSNRTNGGILTQAIMVNEERVSPTSTATDLPAMQTGDAMARGGGSTTDEEERHCHLTSMEEENGTDDFDLCAAEPIINAAAAFETQLRETEEEEEDEQEIEVGAQEKEPAAASVAQIAETQQQQQEKRKKKKHKQQKEEKKPATKKRKEELGGSNNDHMEVEDGADAGSSSTMTPAASSSTANSGEMEEDEFDSEVDRQMEEELSSITAAAPPTASKKKAGISAAAARTTSIGSKTLGRQQKGVAAAIITKKEQDEEDAARKLQTVFTMSIKKDEIETVRSMYMEHPHLFKIKNFELTTLYARDSLCPNLLFALAKVDRFWAKPHQAEMAKYFAEEGGIDPNAEDGAKWTALHMAASMFNDVIIKVLGEQGADPMKLDACAETPLIKLVKNMTSCGWESAAASCHNILEIDGGRCARAQILYRDELHGKQALHWAGSSNASFRLFQALMDGIIRYGALEECLEARSKDGDTPLLCLMNHRNLGDRRMRDRAEQDGDVDPLTLLLSHKADLFAINNKGQNALHIACSRGDSALVVFVLSKDTAGKLLQGKDKDGQTPMDVAHGIEHAQFQKARITMITLMQQRLESLSEAKRKRGDVKRGAGAEEETQADQPPAKRVCEQAQPKKRPAKVAGAGPAAAQVKVKAEKGVKPSAALKGKGTGRGRGKRGAEGGGGRAAGGGGRARARARARAAAAAADVDRLVDTFYDDDDDDEEEEEEEQEEESELDTKPKVPPLRSTRAHPLPAPQPAKKQQAGVKPIAAAASAREGAKIKEEKVRGGPSAAAAAAAAAATGGGGVVGGSSRGTDATPAAKGGGITAAAKGKGGGRGGGGEGGGAKSSSQGLSSTQEVTGEVAALYAEMKRIMQTKDRVVERTQKYQRLDAAIDEAYEQGNVKLRLQLRGELDSLVKRCKFRVAQLEEYGRRLWATRKHGGAAFRDEGGTTTSFKAMSLELDLVLQAWKEVTGEEGQINASDNEGEE